jgi:hypothetical protein
MIEALLKSESALNILTTISLAQFLIIVTLFIGIGIIVYKFRDNIKGVLEDYRQEENQKEQWKRTINKHTTEIKDLKEHHDKDMKSFYDRQLQYRQQSLTKQQEISTQFNEINNKIDALTKLINEHYEETNRLKRNELREKLLTSYRHFTSLETNPNQEWNEMEAEAFWHVYGDYEKLGGNGFMNSTVKPAMERLNVVKIN